MGRNPRDDCFRGSDDRLPQADEPSRMLNLSATLKAGMRAGETGASLPVFSRAVASCGRRSHSGWFALIAHGRSVATLQGVTVGKHSNA